MRPSPTGPSASQAQPWREAYVFFKHEDEGEGPRLAGQLQQLIRAGGPVQDPRPV